MYPFPENLFKKISETSSSRTWNLRSATVTVASLTLSPPPPARCDVLKGSRLWMPENEVIRVAVFQNNHRTAKQNRDFPRIFQKIGISSTRNSMVVESHWKQYKEKKSLKKPWCTKHLPRILVQPEELVYFQQLLPHIIPMDSVGIPKQDFFHIEANLC